MAEENIERELSKLGFGGVEPSPLTGVVSDLALKAAQRKVEQEADELSFWDLVMTRQSDAGTIPSAMSLFDRPEAVQGEAITEDIVNELTAGITDELAVRRILDALEQKGVNYGRAIASEVRRTIEANKVLTSAGLRGAGAMILSDVLDPADAAIMATTATGVAALAPPTAPVTAPLAAGAVKAGRLFSRFKDNKKYLAMAAGVGGTELAALELLRAQSKYDITGGDIILAGTIGAAGSAAFTKLGQVLTKRSMIQQAMRKQADGEPLSDFETTLLRQNDDEILAQRFRQQAYDNDDFGVDEAVEVSSGSGLTRKDYTELTSDDLAAVPKQRGVFAGARGALSAFVRAKNSDDDTIRWLADGLGLNSTGNKVGADGRVTAVNFGALEQRDTLVMRYRLSVANPIRQLREEFLQRSNLKQSDWNVLVSRQLRNPDPNADIAVQRAADVYKAEMKKLAQQAIDADVAGFEAGTISRIQNYAPRIFNRGNIERLRQGKLADKPDGTLNDGWFQLAEEAIRKGQPDLEAEVAKALKRRKKKGDAAAVQNYIKRMARGYIQSVVNPKFGEMARLRMSNGDFNVKDFADIMKAEGFTSADIDIMVDVLTRNVKVKGNKRARPRMILDEMAQVVVRGSDGNTFTLKFNDILEENMENLFDSYVFQLSGAIGLARNGINTNNVGTSFETIMSKATKATTEEKKAIRYMYEATTGEWAYTGAQFAGQEISEGMRQIARRGREVSFAANMGMSGMAALMELSNALFEYSIPTLMKSVPMYGKLIRRAQNGELSSQLAREMTAGTGIGGDGLVSKVTTMRSRLEGDVTEGVQIDGEITKVDEVLGGARMFVSKWSGLQGVTDVLRRVSLFNYASEWAYKHKAGQTAFSAIKREQLGITDDLSARIRLMIDRNAEYLPDGTLEALHVDRWADTEAADIFFASARREATQAVQEMNAGSVNGLLRSEVGKTFFQFLSFPMASMEQQAMRLGVRAANGDAMQVSRILSTAALMGGMMYMSRSYLNSMGRSDQEDYMKRRMEMSEFLQGALSQIGAASLFGYIYQITTGTMDGNTSVMTPPVASMFGAGIKGGADLFGAIGEGELTESQLRSLLRIFPFTSLYGARQILNATANAVTN
ncbi:MAG: hypothetical protein VW715_02005 [Rhodospirillales bacterium]